MRSNKQDRMRRVGYVAILASLVTATAIYYWREDHGDEPGSLNELQSAHAYVESNSQESSVFLFPDGQPTIEVIGTDEFSNHAVKYLMDSRPGRYRRAWGSRNIMAIQVKDFFLSGVDERLSILANISLPDFIQHDIMSSPHASGGCSANCYSSLVGLWRVTSWSTRTTTRQALLPNATASLQVSTPLMDSLCLTTLSS